MKLKEGNLPEVLFARNLGYLDAEVKPEKLFDSDEEKQMVVGEYKLVRRVRITRHTSIEVTPEPQPKRK